MKARRAAGWALLVAGVGACNLPPKDPFGRAVHAVGRDDLLTALRAYDSVPVTHERYPEARAGAAAVEQRMRGAHEQMVEALRLRAEWRDTEALAAFHAAREAWALQPGLDEWIEATELRLKLFRDQERGNVQVAPREITMVDPASTPAAPTGESKAPTGTDVWVAGDLEPIDVGDPGAAGEVPVVEPRAPQVANEPATLEPPASPQSTRSTQSTQSNESPESADGETASARPVEAEPAAGGEPSASPAPRTAPTAPVDTLRVTVEPRPGGAGEQPAQRLPNGEDPVARGLLSVESRLGRGEFEAAVDDLVALGERYPGDVRLRRRLGQVLHQRALLSYGRGELDTAIVDWHKVLAIDPENRPVQILLQRAERERGFLRERR